MALRLGFSFGFGVRFVAVVEVVVVVVRCGAGENDLVEGEVGREDLEDKFQQSIIMAKVIKSYTNDQFKELSLIF